MGAVAPIGARLDRAEPSEMTIESLRMTRPWVLFLGVMSFIGSAFMLLGGVGSLLLGAAAPRGGGPPMAILAVVYIPMAFLYIYPGMKLWQYGQCIGRLVSSRSHEDLEAALTQQKSFWKFAGILTIVLMVVYALAIVGTMLLAVGMSRLH